MPMLVSPVNRRGRSPLLTLIALAAIVCCVAADSIDSLASKFQEQLNNGSLVDKLPPGVVLPAGFNATALPKSEDIINLLKQKCERNAGNADEWPKVETAAGELQTCFTQLVDVEKLQEEIEAAQPKGELDTVFNKYCRKRSIAIECMQNFTAAIEPCLSTEEIAHKQTINKIFDNMLNFVCHKDGDQIALFIAEHGPECFSSKKDALTTCFNQTLGGYAHANITVETLPLLVIGTKECNNMNTLQQCVVDELEHCEESTPANLVDAMFKYIRNETPCVHLTPPPSRQTSARSGTEAQHSRIAVLGGVALLVFAAKLL